jgi:hypothetical protein
MTLVTRRRLAATLARALTATLAVAGSVAVPIAAGAIEPLGHLLTSSAPAQRVRPLPFRTAGGGSCA